MVQAAENRRRDEVSLARLQCSRSRCILAQGQVSAGLVIVTKVLVKDMPEVTLTQNDQVVETLSPDRPDYAFAEWVLPGPSQQATGLQSLAGDRSPRVDWEWLVGQRLSQ